MTLFDGTDAKYDTLRWYGLRIGEMDRTLNSRDQEARGVVYLWAEKVLQGRRWRRLGRSYYTRRKV